MSKKLLLLTIALILGSSSAIARWQTMPCWAKDDELFIVVDGDTAQLYLKVTDVVADTSFTWSLPDDSRKDNLGDPRGECDWIAATNGTGSTHPGIVIEFPENTIYKFEFIENTTSKAEFLYVGCTDGSGTLPDEIKFYCGITSSGTNGRNDVFVTYTPANDSYEVNIDGLDETYGVTAAFTDDDWMLPHDMQHFCDWNETGTDCLRSYEFGVFISGQTDYLSFDHTSKDLVIPGGSTWSHTWDLNGGTAAGDVELNMSSGFDIEVNGSATFQDLSINFASGCDDAFTVDSDGSLTLNEGVTIEFCEDNILAAYGDLIIEGTSNNKVTLKGISTGDWDGVYISGSDADNSSIDYAEIDNAYYGIQVYDSDGIEILNSELTNGNTGVVLSQASGIEMINTTSEDNATGVGVYPYASVRLENNVLTGNTYNGLYLYDGTATLHGYDGGPGDNVITGNGTNGILGLGSYVDAGDSGDGGDNSIYGNTNYHVYAQDGTTVDAKYNWWGSNPPAAGDFYEGYSSVIDYSSYLTQAPKNGAGNASARFVSSTVIDGDTSPGAAGRFVGYISEVRETEGRRASAKVLEEVLRNKEHPQRYLATIFYIGDLAHLGENLKVVLRGEEMLGDHSLPDQSKAEIARALFSVYVRSVKSPSGASRMRNLLQGYGHRDFESGFVDHLYADFSEAVAEELAAQKMDSERSPSPLYEDIEANAYPNPFRGSTMIEFTVDTPSNVELIVYDLLGREVTQLVRAPLSEGHYNFTFDAANLAQGFYFYRLRTGDKMKTGKLIYTK